MGGWMLACESSEACPAWTVEKINVAHIGGVLSPQKTCHSLALIKSHWNCAQLTGSQ